MYHISFCSLLCGTTWQAEITGTPYSAELQCLELELGQRIISLNAGRRGDIPDSKVHWASMGPIWGRQYPGGLHVGPMNFAIWDVPLKPYSYRFTGLKLLSNPG